MPMRFRVPFILASRSPRRRHLLELVGVSFEPAASDVDETITDESSPIAVVKDLSLLKADAVARQRPEALVLGADTIVVLDGRILGKPDDEAHAHRMLRALSGRTHTVYTGLGLVHVRSKRSIGVVEATEVTFAELTDEEIEAYISTGSPMDKAGAYGIQDDRGALYVSRIDGDYYNVVGLPLHRLYRTLIEEFRDLLTPGDLRAKLSSPTNLD